MIEVDCVQGSPEWDACRLGIVTGSSVAKIVTPAKLELSKQRSGYMDELLAEWALGYAEEGFMGNYWTERGHEFEPEATAYYEQRTGIETRPVGFLYRDESRMVGCSPDRMADPDGVIELKNPAAKTHIGYLRAGTLPTEYVPQCQMQLWVTGRKWVDFLSYHPALPPVLIRVEPDPRWQAALDAHVPTFLDELLAGRDRLREMGIRSPLEEA